MKKLVMIFIVSVLVTGLYAQNTFFGTKPGMVMTYAENDASGKTTSYSRMTIKDVQGSGRNMTVNYFYESLDMNRRPQKPPVEMPCKVVIKDNVMTLDMKQTFAGVMKDQSIKMEVTGTPMEIPGNLAPGQKLKDADLKVAMDMGFMKVNTAAKVTEGKCLVIEDITVPAGKFKCHKITQKVTVTAMGTSNASTSVSWYAPNVGTIKTESYDDKNKLTSSSVLVELKGN
jgi:hypothetical protein